ncbi:MAG: hypothetical protein ETSY2_34505 [Candidatus Entotheonella gemina]|uniref:Uncharacterized protein n=1 Tax=Candidatus Entotheonella gemina TaxID=1429439 RepID=W4LYE7_9BACT|nr:MAG: hypothetical protein ETSY2_34505 [Candidatus Entotheonella gemina]
MRLKLLYVRIAGLSIKNMGITWGFHEDFMRITWGFDVF